MDNQELGYQRHIDPVGVLFGKYTACQTSPESSIFVRLVQTQIPKQTSGCWKQLQTSCFFCVFYIFFWGSSQMTPQLDDQQHRISWSPAMVGQMVTPWCACVCVFFLLLCRWLHHRRHRVLLERRRVGRDGGDEDWVASVLHRRLQVGVAKRRVFHR